MPTKVSRIYHCSVHRSVASSGTSNPPVEWTAQRPPLTYTLGVTSDFMSLAKALQERFSSMSSLSPNAQLVSVIFDEVAKGNGAPFWEACADEVVWRTIGEGSWSGEFIGKQTIIEEIFRPLNRVLVERATIPTRVIDGGDVIVVQARGKNLTRDGQRYDNDYVFVIHFMDGKIVKYEEYCDTDLIARVLPDRIAANSMPRPN
jgi:uncharacterized protein